MSTVFYIPANDSARRHLLATGVVAKLEVQADGFIDWKEVDDFIASHQTWVFGWLSYEAKNDIEHLHSQESELNLPKLCLIVPENVVRWNDDGYEVVKGRWDEQFLDWGKRDFPIENEGITLNPRMRKEQYLTAINKLLQHIQAGDIYEVNYCQEFRAHVALKDPIAVWKKMLSMTHAPFSLYVQHNSHHVLCASPERYLSMTDRVVTSQPIKGTIRRGITEQEDEELERRLRESRKEQSENVMIVDLVRNDLSKSAEKGSVKVTELFGIHSFKTVHHMISTITAKVKDGVTFSRLIRDTFPMGSMTGAPKVRAMQLIDTYEKSARGLYSGTIGYITPEGDFDFNVVIRSLIYDESKPYLSCSVGSAITALSDPEAEYDECLLKAEALLRSLR
jgi:para-aminobenzoate synthetase component 1